MEGSTIAFLVGTVLTSGWLGSVIAEYIKGRAGRSQALATATVTREGQLDDLTIELIASAKKDIADLRAEIAVLKPLERQLLHFEEAISHLEALVTAKEPGEVALAQAAARSFLYRIDRTQQALGDIRQSVQVLQSEDAIARKEAAKRSGGDG